MGTFRLFVRFPDGQVWHGAYDSVTDTAARFLCLCDDGPYGVGWAMDDDYEPELDGTGEPVQVATDYGYAWTATALRVTGLGRWCWLTSGWTLPDDASEFEPAWVVGHMARKLACR